MRVKRISLLCILLTLLLNGCGSIGTKDYTSYLAGTWVEKENYEDGGVPELSQYYGEWVYYSDGENFDDPYPNSCIDLTPINYNLTDENGYQSHSWTIDESHLDMILYNDDGVSHEMDSISDIYQYDSDKDTLTHMTKGFRDEYMNVYVMTRKRMTTIVLNEDNTGRYNNVDINWEFEEEKNKLTIKIPDYDEENAFGEKNLSYSVLYYLYIPEDGCLRRVYDTDPQLSYRYYEVDPYRFFEHQIQE